MQAGTEGRQKREGGMVAGTPVGSQVCIGGGRQWGSRRRTGNHEGTG